MVERPELSYLRKDSNIKMALAENRACSDLVKVLPLRMSSPQPMEGAYLPRPNIKEIR